MPEQYNRRLGAVQPNSALRRRFVLIRGGAHSQDDLIVGSVQYLRKLEHENAELRNTAIKLALEIQALGGS